MARSIANPTVELEPVEERSVGFSFENIPDAVVEAQNLLHGLDTATSREGVPPGGARALEEWRVRRDFFGRRPGHTQFGPTPADDTITKIYGARLTGDRNIVVKYGGSTIEALTNTGAVAWTSLTGDLYTQLNRVSVAQFLDDTYSATLERGILRQEYMGFTSVEVVGAPTAKFVTNFADRIVSAYIRDPLLGLLPTKVQWSANGDPTEWDPLVDETAGFEDLVSSPSDTGDEISGIFSVGQNLAIVLRERSIWHITRQPFGIAPFRFTAIITDLGCDLPYTAVRVPGGIIFSDTRTNGVYYYTPGAQPQRLNQKVENRIFINLDDRDDCEGMWDPNEREYVIGIATDSQKKLEIPERFIVNIDTTGWAVDFNPLITAMAAVRDPGDATTIDELVGTIDGLVGTIDELANRGPAGHLILKSQVLTGTDLIVFEDKNSPIDLGDFGSTVRFVGIYEPVELTAVREQRTLKEVMLFNDNVLDVDPPPLGTEPSLILDTSKNDETFVTKKTLTDVVTQNRDKVGVKRQTTGDRIKWRVRTSYANYSLREWFAKILTKGVKKIDSI